MSFVPLAMGAGFGVAFLVTRAMIGVAIKDVPDGARKNHNIVTPTSGGIGIVAGLIVGLTIGFWAGLPLPVHLIASCLGLCVVGAILGLLDDVFELNAILKLAVMLVSCAAFATFGARIETLDLGFGVNLPLGPVIGAVGTALWLVVLVNGVNFMDGANGLSLGCCAIGLLGLSALLFVGGRADDAILGIIGASACLGFLFWNVRGGRIFAGDCGALGIGLLCGAYGVWAVKAGVGPLNVALCFLPLLVDVILTIVWRARRKQNLLAAHSFHAYQRLIRAGTSHSKVAARYWRLTLVCILGALIGQDQGQNASAIVFAALLAILIAAQRHVVSQHPYSA